MKSTLLTLAGTARRLYAAPALTTLTLRDALPNFREGRKTVWLPVALLIVGHANSARNRLAASTHFSLS